MLCQKMFKPVLGKDVVAYVPSGKKPVFLVVGDSHLKCVIWSLRDEAKKKSGKAERAEDTAVVAVPGGEFSHVEALFRCWVMEDVGGLSVFGAVRHVVVAAGGNDLGARGGGVAITTNKFQRRRLAVAERLREWLPRMWCSFLDPIPRDSHEGLFGKVEVFF